MNAENTFDKLTAGLDNDERLTLLKKMKAGTDPETQSLEDTNKNEPATIGNAAVCLKSESLLLRIFMYIKSFFTSCPVETVYNEHRISNIAHSIEQAYPGIINYKNGLLLTDVYNELFNLRAVAEFFRSSIAVYEDNQGSFFAFMGSLIMPELSESISGESNPYSIPFDREVTAELRTSLIHKMDEKIQSILPENKSKLYEAVQCLEWLRQFTHLPFEKFLARFANPDGESNIHTCLIDAASQEIAEFAKVLCNGRRILPEVLESLYMVGANKIPHDNNDFDASEAASKYLSQSQSQISQLKMSINSIPFRKLGCIAFHSFFWQPAQLEGAEDWFVKYKNYWKKLFDQQWDSWLKDRKKEQTRIYLEKRFNFKDFPLLPHRPWASIWDGIPFSREFSMGFVHAFYETLYPVYSPLFKIIINEGDFIQKENRFEFTDAYNELEHQKQDFIDLDTNLSSSGAIGASFIQVANSGVRTIQSQGKADALMRKIESDSAVIIGKFCASCRSIQLILTGITIDKHDNNYNTLTNIATIQGHNNTQFKQQLAQFSFDFKDILELVKNLETIELADSAK